MVSLELERGGDMHTAHAIVGHAVLIPILFAMLGAAFFVAWHLDPKGHGRLSDPLDADLVRRWNALAD
jgi:hypothetical protein